MRINKSEQRKISQFLRETAFFAADIFYNALVIIVLVVLIRNFLISPFRVVGSSMADTLQNKEFILIDKFSYLIGDIDRGDAVVFLPPATSKDAANFEEFVRMDASGSGSFNFRELKKIKSAAYCDQALLRSLWLCHEKVRPNDLIYVAPQENTADGNGQQVDWQRVERFKIDKPTYKRGSFSLQGEGNTVYAVRVYDSMGPEYFVKRIIGVPGDTVKIDGGRVYLKGPDDTDFYQIDESFLNTENFHRTYISQKHRENIYEVPEGYYFVMGDNRNHSNDSRSWLEPVSQNSFPFVPKENISGKVLVVLWPITGFRFIGSPDI